MNFFSNDLNCSIRNKCFIFIKFVTIEYLILFYKTILIIFNINVVVMK